MKKKVPISELIKSMPALELAGGTEAHAEDYELYELIINPAGLPNKEVLLNHVVQCGTCLTEMKLIYESIAATEKKLVYWDYGWAKAAASQAESSRRIQTESGKFVIEISPSVNDSNKGIVRISVSAPYRDSLEGAYLTAISQKGILVLKGKVVEGHVTKLVHNLNEIDWDLLIGIDISGSD